MMQIHASCVSIDSCGVILLGESGCGKSDLALCLIDRGAELVADDQVKLEKTAGRIIAGSPENIKGMLEIRGLGIFRLPAIDDIALRLAVQLTTDRQQIERLPTPEFYECLEVKIPQISIHPFDISSVIKIEQAVATLRGAAIMVSGALKD